MYQSLLVNDFVPVTFLLLTKEKLCTTEIESKQTPFYLFHVIFLVLFLKQSTFEQM